MWLSLGQTKKKSSPTWRQEEKNRVQRRYRRIQDTIQCGDKGKRYEKMSLQRGDEGKLKRNAQAVRKHSPQIRLDTT